MVSNSFFVCIVISHRSQVVSLDLSSSQSPLLGPKAWSECTKMQPESNKSTASIRRQSLLELLGYTNLYNASRLKVIESKLQHLSAPPGSWEWMMSFPFHIRFVCGLLVFASCCFHIVIVNLILKDAIYHIIISSSYPSFLSLLFLIYFS